MTPKRYFVRTTTRGDFTTGRLVHIGFSVCDNHRFDKIEVAEFGPDEREQAEAVCKLLNSNEEEEGANNVRGT